MHETRETNAAAASASLQLICTALWPLSRWFSLDYNIPRPITYGTRMTLEVIVCGGTRMTLYPNTPPRCAQRQQGHRQHIADRTGDAPASKPLEACPHGSSQRFAVLTGSQSVTLCTRVCTKHSHSVGFEFEPATARPQTHTIDCEARDFDPDRIICSTLRGARRRTSLGMLHLVVHTEVRSTRK